MKEKQMKPSFHWKIILINSFNISSPSGKCNDFCTAGQYVTTIKYSILGERKKILTAISSDYGEVPTF